MTTNAMLKSMKSIEEAAVTGKRVLVRVDANVPMDGDRVRDDYRLRAMIPTLEFLLNRKAKVILMAHLGQPKSPTDFPSLKPVYEELSKIINRPISFAPELLADNTKKMIDELQEGEILGLENLRSNEGETKNSRTFAQQLAQYGEIYVNDAFSVSHREAASLVAITEFLPSYAGLLLEREYNILSNLLRNPANPFVVVIGGAKIEDKLPVIKKLLDKADKILLGGGVANTFLAAQGVDVKKSLVNREYLDISKDIFKQANGKVVLPIDYVFDADAIVDIGTSATAQFQRYLASAKTIFWNGNMGKSEIEQFALGSEGIARAMTESGATTIIAGGNTIDICNHLRLLNKMSFASSGGGATLELLSGETMPGIKALG